MEENISELLQYGWMACPILLLFGALKLWKDQPNKARRLLLIGFSLITLSAIFQMARSLGVIELTYRPHYDMSHLPFTTWEPLHKWVYWIVDIARTIGMLIVTFGLIFEAKHQKKQHMSTHLLHD